MALTRSELESVSTPFYDKEIMSQVYDESAFFYKLKKNNSIVTDGGTEIRFPIRYQELAQAEAVDPRAQILYQQKATRTSGKLDWKYYKVDTMIQWDEQVQNSGKEQIINLMADKAEEIKDDLYEKFADDLFTTSQATKSFSGLITIVDTGTTYADIAVADAASWAAAVEDSTTTRLILYGSGSLSYNINTSTFGRNKPSLIITTRNLKSKAESLLQPQERFVDKDLADGGFNNVQFLGIPIVGDSHCPTGYMYGLDMDKFELRVHKDFNFKTEPWSDLKQAGFPNAQVKVMFWVGNLVCKMRKSNFRCTALDYTL